MILKFSRWKLIKKLRSRVRRQEQFFNIKKKYNRKRNNQKIDPEKIVEGIVEDCNGNRK